MDNACDVDSKKSKRKKVDPSFKSKRYRDKLRAEVKALENLIPVDKPTLNKKLDSQTIYRLAIAYLRVKAYFNARKLKLDTAYHLLKPTLNFGAGQTVETFKKCDESTQEHSRSVQNQPSSIGDNPHQRQAEAGSNTFDDIVARYGSNCDSTLDPSILYQIIDGFVLAVSADGTIIFVTENVSKYTGFNQTDLMHRCLYSIIHPQDYEDVRIALEQYHVTQATTTPNIEGKQQETFEDTGVVIENFFCRMRCYHGNTPGYIKLHCSGRSQYLPEMPKTVQTANSILLLYCQPFMKNGSGITDGSNKEVFWSKHDLDLTFKEIEERTILGYSSSDVCEKSLYQLVHPEDLSILANVHRTVTRVTEVQTFFLRLQMKHGGWLWVYCKGKVVCKNSKKFSIVFSHSPVRDEDNVFIKQEALLRRHRLASFLQNSAATNQHIEGEPRHIFHPSSQHLQNQYQNPQGANILPSDGDPLSTGYETDESGLLSSVDALNMTCPSSWHADNDRHSPVLPNSHAVQKILNRERQLCIAEYRRKQYFEQKRALNVPLTHNDAVISDARPYHGMSDNIHSGTTESGCHLQRGIYPNFEDSSLNWTPPYNNCITDYGYNYASPPMQQLSFPCHQDFNNFYFTSPVASSQRNHYFLNNPKQGNIEQNCSLPQCAKGITDNNTYISPYHDIDGRKCSTAVPNLHNFYSSANVRFSMVCNTDVGMNTRANNENIELSYPNEERSKIEIKSENSCDNCCVMSEKTMPTAKQSVQYDIEASVYMRIVEAQGTKSSDTNVDLPLYNTLTGFCESQPQKVDLLKQSHSDVQG